MLKTTIVALFILIFVAACGAERNNDPVEATAQTLSIALEDAVDHKILPTVSLFSSEAIELNTNAVSFCTTPDEAGLQTLQQGWKTLSEKWYKLAVYNFGPVNNDLIFPRINFIDSLRLRGTNYKETVRSEISRNLASDVTLDNEFFGRQVFNKVGILALESAIFETAASEHSTTASEIIAEYVDQPRKCDILKGLSGQIVKHAGDIKDGWNIEHNQTGKSYKALFTNNELEDGTPALTELITSVQGHLDYLQKRNVATVAAQISAHAWNNISSSIDEIESLLNGTEETTVSFFGLMSSSGFQNSVDLVKENIAEVRSNIRAEDADLLEVSLGTLDGNFKREIPTGLEVQLGITFTDGD